MADTHTEREWVLAVVEEMAGTTSFYRASDGARLACLHTGPLPHEIRVSRDGRTAWVSQFGLHDYDSPVGSAGTVVFKINVCTLSIEKRLRTFVEGATALDGVARAPHGIELSPDERTLYVNCEYVNDATGVRPQLLAYDLTSPDLVLPRVMEGTQSTLSLLEDSHGPSSCADLDHRCAAAHHLVAASNGKVLWMMAGAQGLAAVDASTGEALHDEAVLAPPPGSVAIRGLCWSPLPPPGTEERAPLLLASGRDTLATVDTERIAWVNIWSGFGVGQLLYSVATPDGRYILGPAVWNNLLVVVDAHRGTLVRRIPTGLAPIHVAVTPDSHRAYATGAFDTFVTEIDLETFAVRRIATLPGPNGIALVPADIIQIDPIVGGQRTMGAPLLLRLTIAVDMSGPSVPGRHGDRGSCAIYGASTWWRSVECDGGLLHPPHGPPVAVVVEYADLECDESGNTLASIVRDGAPYPVPAPDRALPGAHEIRVVFAHADTPARTNAAIGAAHEGTTLVVLLARSGDSAHEDRAESHAQRVSKNVWRLPDDGPWTTRADARQLSHERWHALSEFEACYWDKVHESNVGPASFSAAAACCLVESALASIGSATPNHVDGSMLSDALATFGTYCGFSGTLHLIGSDI